MKHSFVLKGDICYSESRTSLKTVEGGYLVCEDGVSSGVFKTLPQAFAHLPLIDRGNRLILPGLVDLHLHAPQFSYCCLGLNLELLDWLNTYTFQEEAKFRQLEYAQSAYSVFAQQLKKSATTRACVFATIHVPATLLLMELLEDTGLVTMVGKVNMDRNGHPELQEADFDQSLRDTADWIVASQGKFQRTSPILTPRFIPSCSDALMRGLKDLHTQYGLPVQSHLSENLSEIEWVKALCPDAKFYGDAYNRFGLFGGTVPTIMAHCVWSPPEEAELMYQNQVYIAHCPQSNTNMSSGIAPVRRYLEKGIPTGLGSDVAGGCHLSIFRAMTDAIQVSKLHWRLVDQADAPLTVEEAFYMGTLGGGGFFGRVGSFAPGYEFDALVIDDHEFSGVLRLSVRERLDRVLYLSNDRHIFEKYVGGRKIL